VVALYIVIYIRPNLHERLRDIAETSPRILLDRRDDPLINRKAFSSTSVLQSYRALPLHIERSTIASPTPDLRGRMGSRTDNRSSRLVMPRAVSFEHPLPPWRFLDSEGPLMRTDPDSASHTDNWSRLEAALARSPGAQLERELGALALSARTFDVNAFELRRTLEWFENALPNPLLQPGKRRALWDFSFEVVRLFQNTLASGQSFLEHCSSTVTRRYRKDPFNTEFIAHYRASIDQSPACMFVRELRGFLLHKESIRPAVSRSLVDFSDPFESMCAITLNTDGIETERERWTRQNPKAVEYLDGVGGSINIRRLVHEYRGVVREFADWLLRREREINAHILSDSDTLHEQIAPYVSGWMAEDLAAIRQTAKVESWFT
jgi:hypothetical protein